MISQQTIDEQQLIERYLAGQLTDEERMRFEEYYLEHPEVLRDLDAAARIKSGLAQLERGKLRHSRWIVTGIAASVVAATLLLRWPGQDVTLPALAATPSSLTGTNGAVLPVLDNYEILRERGTSYDAVIELPDQPGVIGLQVVPEIEAEPPRYRVRLVAADDAKANVELGGLVPGDSGALQMYLSSSTVKAGEYRLEVAPETAADTTQRSSYVLSFVPRSR